MAARSTVQRKASECIHWG